MKPASDVTEAVDVDAQNIKAQAQEMGDAFIAGDFAKVADKTYPGLVRLLGGKARMVTWLERETVDMRAPDFTLTSVSVGEPEQFLAAGKRLFAFVPTIMRFKVPQGTLVSQAGYIGVSSDGGRTWTFVDAAGQNKQKLRALFPETPSIADRLKLPERKPPVMMP